MQGGDWIYFIQFGSVLLNGLLVLVDGKYVEQYYISIGGLFYMVNKVEYIDDYWQVVDCWVVYVGLCYDIFINKNVNGQNFFYLLLFLLCLGVLWDVYGDSLLKFGVNVGKYIILILFSVNNGVVGVVIQWQCYYIYIGCDLNIQVFIGLSQIGLQFMLINGLVLSKENVVIFNIKVFYQYEFQFYVQKVLGGSWLGMVEVGYVVFKCVIEDICYIQGIIDYVQVNGYFNYEDVSGCLMINLGIVQVFVCDYNGDGKFELLILLGVVFGLLLLCKYIYFMLEVLYVCNVEELYFFDFSYIWVYLYGNYDGLFNFGMCINGGFFEQIYWDFFGLMEYGNGNLVGDVCYSFKFNGIYYFLLGLCIGSMLDLFSGMLESCLGIYLDMDNLVFWYGVVSYFCNNVLLLLGNVGCMLFFWQWNLGLGYDYQIGEYNLLSVDLQIQNVINYYGWIDVEQCYDIGSFDNSGQLIFNLSYGVVIWQVMCLIMLVLCYIFQ